MCIYIKWQKGVAQGTVLSHWIIAKIYWICINQVYLKLWTRFFIKSIRMFYTNDAGFRWNTIWEKAAPWETPFSHFALALRLSSGYCFEISCDARNELFNVQKIPIYPQCDDVYPGSRWKFLAIYLNLIHSYGLWYELLLPNITNGILLINNT